MQISLIGGPIKELAKNALEIGNAQVNKPNFLFQGIDRIYYYSLLN